VVGLPRAQRDILKGIRVVPGFPVRVCSQTSLKLKAALPKVLALMGIGATEQGAVSEN